MLLLALAADRVLLPFAVLDVCTDEFVEECLTYLLLAELAFHGHTPLWQAYKSFG